MTAGKVLMVEPGNFIPNPQTIGDNFFQQPSDSFSDEELHQKSKSEFDAFTAVLKGAGIEVNVFSQENPAATPDAIFPNNWFSTTPQGTYILYPMMAENRRLERSASVIGYLDKNYKQKIDLTHDEDRGIFLEGTGSLVIDHKHRIAYASLSQRTSSNLIFEWSKLMDYETVVFTSYDKNQQVIYHTNVLMCLAEKFAIVCMEALEDDDAKDRVRKSLTETGHEIIEISLSQVHHFCGNCLELENNKGERFLVMSSNAYFHFSDSQIKSIEKHCAILQSDLHTIETYGGGGARCMMAELF